MVTAAAGAAVAASLVVDGCGRKIHVVAAGSSVAVHVLDACASPQMHGILKRRSGAGGGATSRFCISEISLEGLLCCLLLVWVFVCFLGEKVREAHRSEKKKGGNFSCGEMCIM